MQLHGPLEADLPAAARGAAARRAALHPPRREGLRALAGPRGRAALLPRHLLPVDQQAAGRAGGAELREARPGFPCGGADAHDRNLPEPGPKRRARCARCRHGAVPRPPARGGQPDQGAERRPEASVEPANQGLPVPEPHVHEAEGQRGAGSEPAYGPLQRQEGLRAGLARDVPGADHPEAGHKGTQPAEAHRGPGEEGLQPGVHGRLRTRLVAACGDLHPVLEVRPGLVPVPPRQRPQPVVRKGLGAARPDL
mmetsp:Transcript_72654/g.187412  ORF Transcript_72654/g.187412 Transcript_72654/m.187412 type:complete len:253 (-) Transcript_72654:274-1032(-)